MKLKKLTILLHEGLANRMRVIASVYPLIKDGIKIKILWMLNNELNCNFEKLFQPINSIEVSNITEYPKLFNTNQKNIIKRIIAKVWNKMHNYDFVIGGGFGNKDTCNVKLIHKVLENKQSVFLETCAILFNISDYSIFKPTENILKQVNKYPLIGTEYIGIHIRRGDNIKSQQNSRINLFIEKINEILKSNNNAQFYLATDSIDIKDFFDMYFGKCIHTKDVDYSRNSDQGIIDAYIEMILLSKAKIILGSYWSSFDEVAQKLNGTKLEKITTK
ncbi:MAG: hypothetical protein MJ211_08950 [Bacteroidales bacterium]|nr:hypothetical protein [Bacteroidales bacterium]